MKLCRSCLVSVLFLFGACCLLVSAGSAGVAGDPEIGQIRITGAALFKNGLGFVSGEATLSGGDRHILRAPSPVHGTFMVRPAPGSPFTVRGAVAGEIEVSGEEPATSIAEILEANLGREVTVRLAEGPVSVMNARVVSAPAGSTLVLLETSDGLQALDRSAVRQVTLRGEKPRTGIARTRKEPVLEIETEGDAAGGRVLFEYLSGGIAWAPSYRVEILGPTRARLAASAEIVNEIGDLEGAAVTLVSGFPNIHFAAVPSPLSPRVDLGAFLNALARPSRPARSDVTTQAVMFNVARLEPGGVDFTATPEGAALEDLFFYEAGDVSLPSGRRGHYPLYELEVAFDHVYRWEIAEALDDQGRHRAGPTDQEVWHCLRLANSGAVPWTTAPALTLREGRVMGQDILYFTSPGARSLLRVTRSVDIAVEEAEYEEERERNAASFYGRTYDRVTVRGVLRAASFKAEDINLSIARPFSGEFVSSAPAATVEKTAAGLRRVNPRGRLAWEVPLAAGQTAEIEYRYTVFVRD